MTDDIDPKKPQTYMSIGYVGYSMKHRLFAGYNEMAGIPYLTDNMSAYVFRTLEEAKEALEYDRETYELIIRKETSIVCEVVDDARTINKG